ncbi:hypothetical protein QCA50_020200 [Cerrena zonata]|uniref:F-box domain-containing protein n=1 Tax=Cerrena zonata TaxID=2478898 RepID=A0AAW0FDR5_9APHY
MSYNLRKRKNVEHSIHETLPVVKRAKKKEQHETPPRRLRKKGSLQDLPKMPLDIIYEVLVYLLPNDLLNLARTTKEFRDLLISRNASPFWKAARKNVEGLPDCPPFLSEPAYANLCFQTSCHNCLTGGVQTVLWSLRVRYCKKCQDMLLINSRYEFAEFHRDYGDIYIGAPAVREVCFIRRFGMLCSIYRIPELQDTKMAFEKLDISQRATWLEERKNWCKDVDEWARTCRNWYEIFQAARKDLIAQTKEARLSAIIAKLREEGWNEELQHMNLQYSHPLLTLKPVKQPRKLTERVWLGMRDEVISFMQSYKAKRLLAERRDLLYPRLMVLKQAVRTFQTDLGGMCPPERDIASFPEFRAIIDAPKDVDVSLASFLALQKNLVDLVSRFRGDKKSVLRAFLQKKMSMSIRDDIDIFDLAITAALQSTHETNFFFFDVSGSANDHLYNNFNRYTPENNDDEHRTMYDDVVTSILHSRPWSTLHHDICVELITHIIHCYGEDPADATAAAMDNKDTRLCCKLPECDSKTAHVILTWRAALRHFIERHPNVITSKRNLRKLLTKADDKEAGQVRHLEIEARAAKRISWRVLKYCMHCPENMWCTRDDISVHMQERHGVKQAIENRDFCVHESATFPACEFYLISDKASKKQREDAINVILPFRVTRNSESQGALFPKTNHVVGRFSTTNF